jgi:hypothetical protein
MSGSTVFYAAPRRLARLPVAMTWPVCVLSLLFLLSLPLANPYVHGDGVGYYAYAQSLLIDHNLQFEDDWRLSNPGFLQLQVDATGQFRPEAYTRTGHLVNHFTVGPTILWAPFLLATHAAVLAADGMGAHIPADGHSRPYLMTMALATAFYGFLALLLSFDLARQFVGDLWALLATVAIWFSSSLPVYMYFNPAWSHAHSAFSAALFLWYWQRTRTDRTLGQWIVLGLIAGLMMNVYYPNAVVALVPGLEALKDYLRALRSSGDRAVRWGILLRNHVTFAAVALVALLPTLATRWIIYGNPFESGYPDVGGWNWTSPAVFSVLFSANHGVLSWTPVLIPAFAGLYWFRQRGGMLGNGLIVAALAYVYFIASYPTWDGTSSFGNRFFISLTPIFVIGLAATLDRFGRWWNRPRSDVAVAGTVLALLCVWNAGFIFQWGTQMIPSRGPISWRQMAHNQLFVIPGRISGDVGRYFLRRDSLMEQIEERDLARRQKQAPAVSEP